MKKILKLFLLIMIIICFVGCKDKECMEHILGEWEETIKATCVTAGEKVRKCTKCGQVVESEATEKTAHTIVKIDGVDATCLENGLTDGEKCSVCGEIITERQVINKLGHNYNLDIENSDETYLVYECERCHDTYKENNETGCTNHEESDWVVVKEASCSETGLKEKKCTKCGITIKSQVISMLSHKEKVLPEVLPTCTDDGLTEGIICEVCNTIIKKQDVVKSEGHDYEILSSQISTNEVQGYVEYKCSKCDDVYKEMLPLITDYDNTQPVVIILEDNNIAVTNSNGGVLINGNEIRIVLEGTYSISGVLSEGSIHVYTDDDSKVELDLEGVSVTSAKTHPLFIENADKVEISAKSKTENYFYDNRELDDDPTGAAIYAKTDLELKGKGSLNVESKYNNGVFSSKDLKIKNLTLKAVAINNAIKGKDSITIESGTITAISTQGDALKTSETDISSKGKQRGTVTINEGTLNLYSACDGIDAAYDVVINGGVINIYTDKYSEYSEAVSVTETSKLYVGLSQMGPSRTKYNYSVVFYDENNKETRVNGKSASDGPSSYSEFNKPNDAVRIKIYAYTENQVLGSENYTACTDLLQIPDSKDYYKISRIGSGSISGSWSNFSMGSFGPGGNRPGMGGGMQEGNQDKAEYSCKGIKADNEISITNGTINIKAHDDAIHTNNDVTFDNGTCGSGNINIDGGFLTLYSDDDAIHGDGTININNGEIIITKSYEGVEANYINFNGGTTQIKASDDGINALTNLNITGGVVYLDADGDGIDSNGTITMSGGIVLAMGPKNGGNGVLDFDRTFTFTGGLLLAIGCRGMDQKPTASQTATSKSQTIQTTTSSYVNVELNNEIIATIKVTKSNQNYCVLAYGNDKYNGAKVTITTSTDNDLVNSLYYIK